MSKLRTIGTSVDGKEVGVALEEETGLTLGDALRPVVGFALMVGVGDPDGP